VSSSAARSWCRPIRRRRPSSTSSSGIASPSASATRTPSTRCSRRARGRRPISPPSGCRHRRRTRSRAADPCVPRTRGDARSGLRAVGGWAARPPARPASGARARGIGRQAAALRRCPRRSTRRKRRRRRSDRRTARLLSERDSRVLAPPSGDAPNARRRMAAHGGCRAARRRRVRLDRRPRPGRVPRPRTDDPSR
jgi:hypothetical protein